MWPCSRWGNLLSCWQLEYAIPKPRPAPSEAGHVRPGEEELLLFRFVKHTKHATAVISPSVDKGKKVKQQKTHYAANGACIVQYTGVNRDGRRLSQMNMRTYAWRRGRRRPCPHRGQWLQKSKEEESVNSVVGLHTDNGVLYLWNSLPRRWGKVSITVTQHPAWHKENSVTMRHVNPYMCVYVSVLSVCVCENTGRVLLKSSNGGAEWNRV